MATVHTLTVIPSGYGSSSCASTSNISNGYTDHTSTTYARIGLSTGANVRSYFDYTFDLSSIPGDAYITSILCTVKAKVTTVNSSYINNSYAGFAYEYDSYSADTSTSNYNSLKLTTSAEVGFMGVDSGIGFWSGSPGSINTLRLRLSAKRGSSGTSNSYYIDFYGATLTIEYTILDNIFNVKSYIGGVYKDIKDAYASINGTWHRVLEQYVNINGAWKPCFTKESIHFYRWWKYEYDATGSATLISTPYKTITSSNYGYEGAPIASTLNVYTYADVTTDHNEDYIIAYEGGQQFGSFTEFVSKLKTHGTLYSDFSGYTAGGHLNDSPLYGMHSKFTYNSSNNTINWELLSIDVAGSTTKQIAMVESSNRNRYPDNGLSGDGFFYIYTTAA